MIIQINKKNYTSEFFHTPEKGVWLSRGSGGRLSWYMCVSSTIMFYVCVCLDDFLERSSLFRSTFSPGRLLCSLFFFVWTAVVNAGEGGGERVFSQCTLEGVARHLFLFAMARGRGVGRLVDGGKSLNAKKQVMGNNLWLLLFIIEVRHAICSCFYSMCVSWPFWIVNRHHDNLVCAVGVATSLFNKVDWPTGMKTCWRLMDEMLLLQNAL